MVCDENNNDGTAMITVPEYLSKNYFEKVLKNGSKIKQSNENNLKIYDNNNENENNDIEIINVKFSMGSSGGENYCSDIYRALIEYEENNNDDDNGKTIKEISLIIKYITFMKKHSNILEEMGIFNKEILMLQKIMPIIEKILNTSQIFAPRMLYSSTEPAQTIVMQDLNTLGYRIADRLEGLDETHSKVLLWKLGQYHAASMILAKNHPELMKPFNKGFLQDANVESDLFKSIFIKNLDHICNILSKWSNYDTIIEKLKKLEMNFKERALKCIATKESDIKVLNHGDLWVNNFMFKYNNNIPCDVVFIDLQISYYGGLGVDLNYFLNTSVQIEVLKAKRYELIRHYYKSLRTTLEQLNYPTIPTWNDIKNEINDKEFFGFIAFEAILPLISMDREHSKTNNFETLSDEKQSQEKRNVMFSSKRMLETLRYSLDRFDELGVLD